MNEWLVVLGIVLHALSGVPGLFCPRTSSSGQRLALALAGLGSVAGVAGALGSLWWPQAPDGLAWLRLDAIAVVFLLPIFVIPALGGLYGLEYWRQAEHPWNGRKLRLFYGLVAASLALVTVAAHSIVFLAGWEVMALSAFFLVTTEDEEHEAREAGWLYLVATHTTTLFLFAFFALLWNATGSFSLGPQTAAALSPALATAAFWLAIVAFGCKAGLMPLHIWLPSAHATTPSHVSALMSGVLIKIGIYGLVRMFTWLPPPPLWWGGTLLALGMVSGVLGVVLALGQHDLKRLLAYHSIENIGIIVMGLGLAAIGRSMHCVEFVVLGLAGALLHVWNHGLFKALLFLCAGSVVHQTHTRDIERLGGLARAMPRTAFFFALGAVAICGLPPLNGFVSELLIYLGAFRSLGIGQAASCPFASFVAPALALIGALAVACFVKAFGVVFLGDGRSPHTAQAHESGRCMTGPMLVLASGCIAIGTAPWLAAPLLDQAIGAWIPGSATKPPPALATLAPLDWVSLGAVALLGLLVLATFWLRSRLARGGATAGPTWDCGYAAPTPRMQYTASSFAQMLDSLFAWVQQPRLHRPPAHQPIFPGRSEFSRHTLDLVLDTVLKPAYRFVARVSSSFRFLQAGNIHAYLFYIVLFLMVLLLWR